MCMSVFVHMLVNTHNSNEQLLTRGARTIMSNHYDKELRAHGIKGFSFVFLGIYF